MRNRLKKKHYKYFEYMYYNPDKYYIRHKKITGEYPMYSMGEFLFRVANILLGTELKNKNKKWVKNNWRHL